MTTFCVIRRVSTGSRVPRQCSTWCLMLASSISAHELCIFLHCRNDGIAPAASCTTCVSEPFFATRTQNSEKDAHTSTGSCLHTRHSSKMPSFGGAASISIVGRRYGLI